MYLGFSQLNAPKPALLLGVSEKCASKVSKSGLTFSFHHSRAEGWAAIYEAVATAGLYVVAAHPVYAELRAASPKTAARDPISLDAILVCRKYPRSIERACDEDEILRTTQELVHKLEGAGMTISSADRFVIGAARMLIVAGVEQLSFEDIEGRLETLWLRLRSSQVPPVASEVHIISPVGS